jgi:hypothetical protein
MGCPEDTELQRLGGRFYELIIGARWAYAKDTLEEIEKRGQSVLYRAGLRDKIDYSIQPKRYTLADLLPPGT